MTEISRSLKRKIVITSVLSLSSSLLVGFGASGAHAADTISVAVVNNPDMIRMEGLVSDFTKSTGIKVKFETLPDALSLAETFMMPLASMSKVTSIWG